MSEKGWDFSKHLKDGSFQYAWFNDFREFFTCLYITKLFKVHENRYLFLLSLKMNSQFHFTHFRRSQISHPDFFLWIKFSKLLLHCQNCSEKRNNAFVIHRKVWNCGAKILVKGTEKTEFPKTLTLFKISP